VPSQLESILEKDKNSVEINSYNHFKEFINSVTL